MRIELIILIFVSLGGQDCTASCIVELTQSRGTCKLLDGCPAVINDIKHGIYSHTRCVAYAGNGTEIVCCPELRYTTTPSPYFARISESKCNEYKSAVFRDDPASSSPFELPTKLFINRCPLKSNGLIPNAAATRRDYPHVALIGYDSDDRKVHWLYSGTLISDEYVLTAAQATNLAIYGKPKYVRLAELNFNYGIIDLRLRRDDYNISVIIPHPGFKRPSNYHDIALLKLHKKVVLSAYLRPACLPKTFSSSEKKVISAGWSRDLPYYIPEFKHVLMEQLTTTECNAIFSSYTVQRLQRVVITDTQLCAELKTNLKVYGPDVFGGPLQMYYPEQQCTHVVIGVRSFRITGDLSFPEVYTRVFRYLDWIENVVWINDS